jgi:RND family efflux transporter MFP subunit
VIGHEGCRNVSWTIVLALAMVAVSCGREGGEEVETQSVVPVRVAVASIGDVRALIRATGIVMPAPGADFIVTPPEAARIVEMPKAEGDRVRRGDLLVHFEIPSLGAEAATKTADVERADARLQNARAAQVRARDLFERGVGARKEMEDADRELAEAQAALKEAQAGRAASAALTGRTIVRAPFDGVVARRTKNPGDLVDPSASEPLLRLVDANRLEVQASIPVADVPRIEPGAPARASVSSGVPPERLKVISRPAAVEPGTAAAPVRLAFLTPTKLAVGTPVQVSIDAEAHPHVVLVPASAVVREGDDAAVFVVGSDNKAHRKAVTLGITNGEQAEVISGVKSGERVIVNGQNGLPDGAPVTVAE